MSEFRAPQPPGPSNNTANNHNHGQGQAKDVPLLEFDGTTVLCRVCGDKASGFHYGVHSCEGCKGFFRRSIQQKIQYRPCTKNQQCSILRVNRNRCQYCRLKKCIAVGMSRDAVRFGRVPKREKAKILAAMQQSHHAKSAERALTCELEDLSKLTATIIQAHIDTCEFTREKVKLLYQKANYSRKDGDQQSPLPIPTLACPLNPHPHSAISDFSERFSPAIRGVVEFAKRLPGFSILSQDDQVTLLKAGVFEILLVRLACMFEGNSMLCINGQILERDTVSAQNARFLLDSMFKFAEQFNKIGLNDEQIGMFCAMVVIAPDRPGLRNVELVTKLQSHIRSSMSSMIAPFKVQELERKIPDLRTLNTLHSEKLLAFKMEESQSSSLESANSCANQCSSQGLSPPPISQPLSVSSHRSSKSSEDAEILSSDDSHHELNHSFNSPSTSPLRNSISEKICPYSMGSSKYPGLSSSSSSSGIESPSGDSGIESGACCSPARSEQDSVGLIVNLGQNNSNTQEEMPVLKRALQAPPMVDTNLLMNEAYRPHKKFRYTSSTSSTFSSSSASPTSRLESPVESPEAVAEKPGCAAPAHQLYPQLASALTQPKLSMCSSPGKTNCVSPSVNSSRLLNPSFKSPLSMTHSTLAKTLNEKPKMLSQESALASDLLHTLIMRGSPMEQCVDPMTRNSSPKSLQQHNQMYTYNTKLSRDNSPASNFFDSNMLVTTNTIHSQANGPLNLSKKVL